MPPRRRSRSGKVKKIPSIVLAERLRKTRSRKSQTRSIQRKEHKFRSTRKDLHFDRNGGLQDLSDEGGHWLQKTIDGIIKTENNNRAIRLANALWLCLYLCIDEKQISRAGGDSEK